MQRKESSITEFKIPRSYLQNPRQNDPTSTALGNENSLKWIGDTIDKIAKETIDSYDIVVDVDNPSVLYPSEIEMLEAIRNYCTDNVNKMRSRDSHLLPKSTSLASSANTLSPALSAADPASEQAPVADTIPAQQSIETAASASAVVAAVAAAITTATTETIVETATTTAAAVSETSAAAAAAAAATTATSATTAASESATAVDTLAAEHPDSTTNDLSTSDSAPDQAASDFHDAPPPSSPPLADTKSTEDKILLDHLLTIINLYIWAKKGKGMLGYSDPDGIFKMKNLTNPTLDAIFKIARDKHCQSGFSTSTRANTTGRFYEMLFTLQQPANAGTRLKCIQDYAKLELICNHKSSKNKSMWTFGKVVLFDEDINRLCLIAGIQAKDIEALANAAAAATTDAGEVPQIEVRP
jgi:hypothetical protein